MTGVSVGDLFSRLLGFLSEAYEVDRISAPTSGWGRIRMLNVSSRLASIFYNNIMIMHMYYPKKGSPEILYMVP